MSANPAHRRRLRRATRVARLPDPRAPGARQAAGIPRQRGFLAAARERDRGGRRLRTAAPRQRASRRAPAEPGSHAMFEHARERVREFVNAASYARSHLHARHHRVHQPRGAVLRAPSPAARRRDPADRRSNTTPTSCRGSWSPEQTGAVVKAVPMDRRGVIDVADCRRAHERTHAHRRLRACVQCARHGAAGARDHAASRMRAAPWCSSTARRPCRTSAWTSKRSTAISTRSRRTRCTAPPASACSSAASRCSRPCRRGRAAAT